MNTRSITLLIAVAILSATGAWWAAKRQPPGAPASGTTLTAPESERKVLFYQSAMHPWVKSDQPGKCTICGMPLTPVFEGQKGLDTPADLVVLSASSITVSGVRSEVIGRQKLHKTLRVAGVLEDDDTKHRRLSATIEGRIEELHVQYTGAEVVEGEPLATFHSLPLLALEHEYLGILKQLEHASDAIRPGLEQMRQSAERRLLLMGIAKQQIASLPQRPEDAHLVQILSPMSGTVVSREVYAGQYVKEGEKLFELADFSTMWFKFDAYERDLPWIKLGLPVDVSTPAVPGKSYLASIRFIDPNLNEATRSAKVRVEVPNPLIEEGGRKRRELLHRLYAEGVVDLTIPEVLTVPRTAVLNPNGQPVVYLDRGDGQYQQRKVRLGRLGDLAWEVLEGLEEGDRVVTMGNLLLDSQAQLNAGNAAPAKTETAPPTAALTTEASKATEAFLTALSNLGASLAADDLERFNQERSRIAESLTALLAAIGDTAVWKPLLSEVSRESSIPQALDLPTARQSFHRLSGSASNFAKAAQRQPGLGTFKIYQCPMTAKAFPGAPKTGVWLQGGGPIRNPYFGAEMLDCGTEIKP
ncbi:MAG: efflux RND transporter periplasmic adaptor subunit [Verrucomicrobiales bacterium]|nr:efflux RND transporter periplasmic adaptor subunit [Verrucomicrobiales bacterium]